MNSFLVFIPRKVVLELPNKKNIFVEREMWYTREKGKGIRDFGGRVWCAWDLRERRMRFWWENLVRVRHKRKAYEVLVGQYGERETVGFVVDKATVGQLYLRVLRFPLSISFQHCSTLVFIYMFLLPGRQKASIVNFSKSNTIWYDIFVNCNWVGTRWQQYGRHLHTNNTQNNTMNIKPRTKHI